MRWANMRIIVKDTLTNETLGFDTLDEAATALNYTREHLRKKIMAKRLLQNRYEIKAIESNKSLSLQQ